MREKFQPIRNRLFMYRIHWNKFYDFKSKTKKVESQLLKGITCQNWILKLIK